MILKFPDLKTLCFALTSGAVPSSVSQVAAVVGLEATGPVWVDTSASMPRANQNELKKLGVVIPRTSNAPLNMPVSSWLEILPLEKERAPVERLEQTPVLFDVATGPELSQLVIEVLRLGNDRQGFRWLEEGKEGARGLLRVVGPPYYTLLRAMDHIGGSLAPVAYLERAPRVWVELGYTHPLVEKIKPPQAKLLFMRPERQWLMLDEAPFRDVYEVLEFPLPDAPVGWKDGKMKERLRVAPSLKPGGSTDGAELWVLRDDPVAELNRFVQNAPDDLLQRLAFGVGEHDGKLTIVLRVRQSKQSPPVLVLKADPYKHYLKLPNLFLPVGTRLHPPLRRDVVRKLVAEDTSMVTWLEPKGAKGSFTPETLPEDAFRPLCDWVDYVLDHDRKALQAWVQAAQFDFEPFICDEDQPKPKGKGPDTSEKTRSPRGQGSRGGGGGAGGDPGVVQFEEVVQSAEDAAVIDDFGTVAKVEPSVAQQQLRALEERFLEMEGGLDSSERLDMWPQMARFNAELKNVDDAGICWMNAIWERSDVPTGMLWAWFMAEASEVPIHQEAPRSPARSWVSRLTAGAGRNILAEDVDRLVTLEEPATADLRALAAYLTFASRMTPAPQALVERLGRVTRFLEKHEKLLPVRAVWLAWASVAQLASGDVLALARARDRLLERLYNNGLRPEQDLPSFLRFAGQPTSQRFRAVRQWMSDLCTMALEWAKEGGTGNHASAQTAAYVEMTFAFGLARLGENDAARDLLNRARAILNTKDDAHQFLAAAYEFRVRQAMDGKRHSGPLPSERLQELEIMDRLLRYVVDRLRKHSHILEPDERINPYRHWGARISEFERALAELTDLTDRNEVVIRVDRMLREVPKGAKGAEQRGRVLRAGLEVAPRVNEDFGRRMLEDALKAYDALPEAKEPGQLMEQAALLEKALFVAAHFDRIEHIHPLVARFQRLLQAQRGAQALQALDSLAAQCFRGLRKLGMRDEIDQLLKQMAELVLEGQDIKNVDFRKRENGAAALRALLHVASGWYYFAKDAQAEPILQATRTLLLQGELLPPREQTQLAGAYAKAVGQAPVEVAQKRLEEIFKQLKGVKDTYTTSSHFSVSQLDVVEAVVLAVVSEDFTQGSQARRWLDDDEFLVRRRIHRDLRALMPQS